VKLFTLSCFVHDLSSSINRKLRYTGIFLGKYELSLSESESYVTTTVSRPVCLGIKHPSGAYDQIFITVLTVAGLLMWGVLSDERTGLLFAIATAPRQRSHSRV
jgi:hypothetical protein